MQNCGSYSKKIFADLNLIHTDMKAAIYNPYWDTLGGESDIRSLLLKF